MASPAPSWNTVRVRGTWVNQDGTRKTGSWRLEMPTRVTNATDDVIIPKGVSTGNLSVLAGQASLDLQVPASDDPDNTPTGFQPILTITFNDGTPAEVYKLTVPVALTNDVNGINLRNVALAP